MKIERKLIIIVLDKNTVYGATIVDYDYPKKEIKILERLAKKTNKKVFVVMPDMFQEILESLEEDYKFLREKQKKGKEKE